MSCCTGPAGNFFEFRSPDGPYDLGYDYTCAHGLLACINCCRFHACCHQSVLKPKDGCVEHIICSVVIK